MSDRVKGASQSPAGLSLQARAAGMLAGVALGDALGMPAEFLTRETIRAWYGAVNALRPAHPNHPHHNLPAASVTDDTDHTWLIARLLLQHGAIEPQPFAAALLDWSRTPRVQQNRFIGPSTRQALEALQAGTPLDEIPRGGTTVGAAMRTAALAIVFPSRGALAGQVAASCALTHHTHLAVSGAMAMAYAQAACFQPGASLASVLDAMMIGAVDGRAYGAWCWCPPIEKRIRFVLDWVASHPLPAALDFLADIIGTDYYPDQLVPCTAGLLWLSNGEPGAAMRLAANLGGDTDTLASMVGSLCGGLAGLAAFDADMLRQVQRVNDLDCDTLARDLLALRAAQPSHPQGEL